MAGTATILFVTVRENGIVTLRNIEDEMLFTGQLGLHTHPEYEEDFYAKLRATVWAEWRKLVEEEDARHANECEHRWRDYSQFGGDYEKTPIVCRDCGKPAPPEVVAQFKSMDEEVS